MAESLKDQVVRQQGDRHRELIRLALVDAFNEGMDRGDDQATIDTNLSTLKRILEKQYGTPFSMANGGEATENVGIGPLSSIARDMNRGPKGIASFENSGGEASGPPPRSGPDPQGIVQRFNQGGVSEYRESLFGTESFGGKLDAENKRTRALGASQAMPDTLEDFKKDTDQSFSNDQYKKSADLQSQFQGWYENKTLQYIADNNLNEYIGTKVKGIPVTLSGMMAVAHLGGNYGMRRFLESDGRVDPSDNPDNPEQGTKLSDYLAKHSGLNVYGMQEISDIPSTEGDRLVMNQPFEAPDAMYASEAYNNPAFFQRPMSRPFMPTEPMLRPKSRAEGIEQFMPRGDMRLQEKYSPEGIEQLLTGATDAGPR